MHVTQSTMSGILRRLRDQFDDELLVRNGRRYDLSPFAQSLAISVRQTILQIDSTISAKPLFDPQKDRRCFRIMASDYSTMVYLSAVFRRIEKQAPHLSYDIVPINSPLDHVRTGTVDLCITGNPYSQAEAAGDHLLRADTAVLGSLLLRRGRRSSVARHRHVGSVVRISAHHGASLPGSPCRPANYGSAAPEAAQSRHECAEL